MSENGSFPLDGDIFQTCMDNGYSKVKILTASPINGSAVWNKKQSLSFSPQ